MTKTYMQPGIDFAPELAADWLASVQATILHPFRTEGPS